MISPALLRICWALLLSQPATGAPAPSPDAHLCDAVTLVLDKGSTLYNQGDEAGCYRLYQGALIALGPTLDRRPELEKVVSAGLAAAGREPVPGERAWRLRRVLDRVWVKALANQMIDEDP